MRSSVLAAIGFLSATVLSLFACSSDETTDTSSTGSGASATTSTAASTGGGGATSSSAASTGGPGGSGGSGGSTGGAGGTGGGTGGMAAQSGDCDSDADCPGQTCVEVTPGGFTTCTSNPPTSNGCVPACKAGTQCFPQFGYCGGIVGPMDTCYGDECMMDADCMLGPQVCVKAGVLGRPANMCMTASCKHDTDCTAQPGGACQPVDSACCGIVEALYCVYPNEGCRHESDCPGGYCTNDGTKSFCKPGKAPCPV